MREWEIWTIRIWTWIGLIISGASFTLLIPETMDFQKWIYDGWSFISFPIWFMSGIILGIALSTITDRWPKRSRAILGRGLVAFFAYFGIAMIIALMTGEGEGFQRIGNSEPMRIWGIAVWSLISMGPSMFGVIGIMNRSKWARGASALSFIVVAAIAMIFSQARSAMVISQDPVLSIVFVVSLVAYVEGVNWSNRYIDPDRNSVSVLWRRQISFTILFLGIGSAIAFIPFILTESVIPAYEGTLVYGKAILGAFLLVPIGIFAIVKNLLDNRNDM